MDLIVRSMFMGSAGAVEIDENPLGIDPGDSLDGGYFAGYISHTANGVPTHALIVAPAATGATGTGYTLTTNKSWQSPSSTTGATNEYDGAANTALITNSDALDFCTGLTIGGYSDWYLPARYELLIAYYNLKPTTDSNRTGSGINDYSVPKRTVVYTPGDPAQTSVTAFQTGNSEAFSPGFHWSSTETASDRAQKFRLSNGGRPDDLKSAGQRVRAFRKFAL